jgi:hypothetical protein
VDNDLGRIQLAFGDAGLNDFEVRDGQVFVVQSRRDQYLKALAQRDALPDISRNLYETEPTIDFWSNRHQQQELALTRKKQLIRQMLLQLGFVSDAYVDLDQLTDAGFPPKTTRRAAVVIRPKGDRILERHQIRAIRDTICGQVAGLEGDDVVITDIAAGHAYHGESLESSDSSDVGLIWLEQTTMTQRVEDWVARYGEAAEVKLSIVTTPPGGAALGPPPGENPSRRRVPAKLIVNQPAALPQSLEAAAGPRAPEKSYWVNVAIRIPCPCLAPDANGVAVPSGEQEIQQLKSTVAAEVRALLASDVLDCQPGKIVVDIARAPDPLASNPAVAAGELARWTRTYSLMVLIAAVVALGFTLPRFLRSRPARPETVADSADRYLDDDPGIESRGQIPLNDEARRRLRRVVEDNPDKAAEIIKQWIRGAA